MNNKNIVYESIVPKEIREKFERRNQLKKELINWCELNLDEFGLCSETIAIVDEPQGDKCSFDDTEQWIENDISDSDCNCDGFLYFKLDTGKYLRIGFVV